MNRDRNGTTTDRHRARGCAGDLTIGGWRRAKLGPGSIADERSDLRFLALHLLDRLYARVLAPDRIRKTTHQLDLPIAHAQILAFIDLADHKSRQVGIVGLPGLILDLVLLFSIGL